MKKLQPGILTVSLRALAAYLEVSPSLLSMTNTRRHDARQPGAAQSKKMGGPVAGPHAAQKPHAPGPSMKKMQERSADNCARLAAKMLGIEGCVIYTKAEIVFACSPTLILTWVKDEETGFAELVVSKK